MNEETTKPEKRNELASASAVSQKKASDANGVTLADNRNSTTQLQKLTQRQAPTQRIEAPNATGLPDNLKSGMENLSGMSLDHVKVHYNSSKPAAVQAHAYAQGNEIHLASGQEQHLPHELGHVVQQAQGRVQASTIVNGTPVNDNQGLENEATQMGDRALQMHSKSAPKTSPQSAQANPNLVQQFKSMDNHGLADVGYTTMSKADYGQWQNTVQCKSTMHGVAEHGDQVFVTQFLNPKDVMQQAGFLGKAKGWLVALEGVLAIAAGVALTAVTAGLAAIPGIVAIIVGTMKVIRGMLMIYDGKQKEHSPLRKVLIDTLRHLEAIVALVGGTIAGNPALIVFGAAKTMRSLLSYMLSGKKEDANSTFTRVIHGISSGLHFIEVAAGTFAGVSSVTEGGTAVVGGALTLGVAASKFGRASDSGAAAMGLSEEADENAPLNELSPLNVGDKPNYGSTNEV
ncbi:MAG: hypothetical protein COA42_06435 [Alteromonadaceae bacterium]|nr:MAG: hypothetical protein COA42_06435 [Alteromonadaceae bacterium]